MKTPKLGVTNIKLQQSKIRKFGDFPEILDHSSFIYEFTDYIIPRRYSITVNVYSQLIIQITQTISHISSLHDSVHLL